MGKLVWATLYKNLDVSANERLIFITATYEYEYQWRNVAYKHRGHTSEFRRQYGGSTAVVRRQSRGSTAAVRR